MKSIFILSLSLCTFLSAYSQEILTKEQAIDMVLKNNYDVKVSKNNLVIANLDTSIFNSGYLPSLVGNASSGFSNKNSEVEFQDGNTNTIDGAESTNYNLSVGVNYTVFNGFNRKYTYKKLKERYKLLELENREVIESTFISLFTSYYEVARLTENVESQKQALQISKQRLKRLNYSYDYGQSSKLDVLNAEVDVNNDSISYLGIRQELINLKRDLNYVLGREVNTVVEVDTTVVYSIGLQLEDLLNKAKENNVTLLQSEKNVELSQFDIKINKSGWLPTVNLSGTYDWTTNKNDATTPFSPISSTQNGINTSVNLTWNIFDGGKTKIDVQKAKITYNNQDVLKQQQQEHLNRAVNNAWETYQNAKFIHQARKTNVLTNKHNFKRTQEQYKLGQVTSLDFRQAQLNLINSELSLSQAKYDAKNAELKLLQLAGILL